MSDKEDFINQLLQWKSAKENHFTILTSEDYSNLIEEITLAKQATKKTALQYRRLNRFDILEIAGVKKLISKIRTDGDDVRLFLSVEEIFDVIEEAHRATGHGGRDRVKKELAGKYVNITLEMINLFTSNCEVCQSSQSKKRKKEPISKHTLQNHHLNSRCQVDLIDMHFQPDEPYKFIMVYQDHSTRFIILKPLRTTEEQEIAQNVVDTFTLIGAPCILHSDNGREFAKKLIVEINKLWPEVKLVCGKPTPSQAKQDVENKIAMWMKDSNSKRWSEALRFVQFMINKTVHSGIRQSPFKALFGKEPRMGLSTLLPVSVLNEVENEEDLENITSQDLCQSVLPDSGQNVKTEGDYTSDQIEDMPLTSEGRCCKVMQNTIFQFFGNDYEKYCSIFVLCHFLDTQPLF